MNYIEKIKEEGFRRIDLSDENQTIMRWLDYLVESIDGFESEYEDEVDNTSTLIDRIKNEIEINTIEEIRGYLKGIMASIQISLKENEPINKE